MYIQGYWQRALRFVNGSYWLLFLNGVKQVTVQAPHLTWIVYRYDTEVIY